MAVVGSAVAAVITEVSVASILSAISSVGLASTVVGVVTGKPNLIKIGGELGLVGGIGSLVNGAVNGMAGNLAGVAEGASESAYSDVAGEKFATAMGQDAAGSGFGAAASDAAQGMASSAGDALASTANTTGLVDSVVAPKSTDILDLSKPSAGVADSVVNPSKSAFAGTDLATDAKGMYTGAPTNLTDAATSNLPTGTAAYTASANDVATLAGAPGSTLSDLAKLKDKIGSAWDSLSSRDKIEMLKMAGSVVSGIQEQRSAERANDITQQRVNQSSYGSAVPKFGIIAKAQKGG